MVMRKLASGAALAAATLMTAGGAFAADLVGQPTPGAIDFQPAASPLKHQVIFFHNFILLPITVAISLFVLGLLLFVEQVENVGAMQNGNVASKCSQGCYVRQV